MNEQLIVNELRTTYLGRSLFLYDTIDSTNTRAKQLADGDVKLPSGTVVIADKQTDGKGRFGRSFLSEGGKGLYMTILIKPGIISEGLSFLGLLAPMAVAEALEDYGVHAQVKWPNDVIFEGRKVSGISLSLHAGEQPFVLIGIGVNTAHVDYPEDLKDKAISVEDITGFAPGREELAANILNRLEPYLWDEKAGNSRKPFLIRYKERLAMLGSMVTIGHGETFVREKAVDVDSIGRLITENECGERTAHWGGEVSVRGVYGYEK